MAVSQLAKFWKLVSYKCNNFLLPGSSRSSCLRFLVDGYFVGFVRADALRWLLLYPKVFLWNSDSRHEESYITLHPSLNDVEERTAAVDNVMRQLRAQKCLEALKGWRDEEYGVYVGDRQRTLLRVERSASALLGITRYGVHINGYFVHRAGEMPVSATQPLGLHYDANSVMMWIGVRSRNKPTWPGMLDNIAAGGLTYGLTVLECARKECLEEAGVPDSLLASLTPVGRLSYIFEDERGVCPQVEYCFDLELPHDFVPFGADGEVEQFQLVSIAEVMDLIFSDHFKDNSALVILDFLYRHNFIDASSDPQHTDIQSLMHVQFEFD